MKTKKHQQFLKLQAMHPNVTIIDEKVQELVNNYHNNIRRITHGLANALKNPPAALLLEFIKSFINKIRKKAGDVAKDNDNLDTADYMMTEDS